MWALLFKILKQTDLDLFDGENWCMCVDGEARLVFHENYKCLANMITEADLTKFKLLVASKDNPDSIGLRMRTYKSQFSSYMINSSKIDKVKQQCKDQL